MRTLPAGRWLGGFVTSGACITCASTRRPSFGFACLRAADLVGWKNAGSGRRRSCRRPDRLRAARHAQVELLLAIGHVARGDVAAER